MFALRTITMISPNILLLIYSIIYYSSFLLLLCFFLLHFVFLSFSTINRDIFFSEASACLWHLPPPSLIFFGEKIYNGKTSNSSCCIINIEINIIIHVWEYENKPDKIMLMHYLLYSFMKCHNVSNSIIREHNVNCYLLSLSPLCVYRTLFIHFDSLQLMHSCFLVLQPSVNSSS